MSIGQFKFLLFVKSTTFEIFNLLVGIPYASSMSSLRQLRRLIVVAPQSTGGPDEPDGEEREKQEANGQKKGVKNDMRFL